MFLSSRSIMMRNRQCPIRQHGWTVESACLLQGPSRLCRRPESRFPRPQGLRCPTRVAGSPHLRVLANAETLLLQVVLRAVPVALLQRADGHRWVAVPDSRYQVQARSPAEVPADVRVDVQVEVPADEGHLDARVAGVAVVKNSSRWTFRRTPLRTQLFRTEWLSLNVPAPLRNWDRS